MLIRDDLVIDEPKAIRSNQRVPVEFVREPGESPGLLMIGLDVVRVPPVRADLFAARHPLIRTIP